MAIISYDYGHGVGQDRGAEGIVNEEVEIRRYAPECISKLEQSGHTCVNCTPTDMGMNLQQSLSYRTDKANASGSVLHICFHVDAFQHTANPMGAEIEVASDNGARYGQAVLTEVCKLGFINRGIKYPNLWVTKNTNMTACLIEPFFVDSEADVALYNPQTLGEAIANGVINILGKGDIVPTQPTPQPVQPQPQPIDKIAEAKKFIGTRCTELQTKLNKVGYKLTVDGDLGINTYNSIIDFQSKNQLTVDGLFGTQSWSKLESIVASLNVVKPTPQPQPTQSVNSNLQALQNLCNQLGVRDENGNALVVDGLIGQHSRYAISHLPLVGLPYTQPLAAKYVQGRIGADIDGIFGNQSAGLLKTWQNSRGLVADGICGANTWLNFI